MFNVATSHGKNQDILTAALGYAALGLPVVQIKPRDKKPMGLDWQRRATSDPNTLACLWQFALDANVGIQMGRGSKPIIDIECDSPEAEEAYQSLWDGKPPRVPSYRGRRGRHYLFKWRPGLPDKAAFHCGALEVRTGNGGKGAQSVFPPSIHPTGAVYAWEPGLSLDDVPLGSLPDDIVAKLQPASDSTPNKTVDNQEVVPACPVDKDEATQQARHWLSKIPGTQSGMGLECDRRVSRIAVLLVHGFALEEETAVELLTEWGQRDDQTDAHGMPDPWTEKEMIRKVTWAVGQDYEGSRGDKVRWNGHELDAAVEAIIKPAPAMPSPAATDATQTATEVDPAATPTAPEVDPAAIQAAPGGIQDIIEAEKRQAAQQAAKPKPQRAFKISELALLPKPTWHVQGMFTEQSIVILWGESGSGKTFLGLDWALCTATGKAWLGSHPVKRGNVVYIASEGKSGLPKRCLRWLEHHKQPEPENFWIVPEAFELVRQESFLDLVRVIGDLADRHALIVIDTLNRNLGGSENDGDDMRAFTRAAEILQRTFGATVLVIHHTGWDTVRERGHSSLRGNSDTMISVRKMGDRLADGIEVKCVKQKDADLFDTFGVACKAVGRGDDSSLVLTGEIDMAGLTEEKLNADLCLILKILPDAPNGETVAAVMKATGMKEWRVRRLLGQGIDTNCLIKVGDGRVNDPATYYRTTAGKAMVDKMAGRVLAGLVV